MVVQWENPKRELRLDWLIKRNYKRCRLVKQSCLWILKVVLTN
jgi:hypothetical protein